MKIVRIIAVLILFSFNLAAQEAADDAVITERIRRIQDMLAQDQKGTDLWWWGWLAGYGAATAGQGVVYFMSEDIPTKQDMALGAATTVLGMAGQFITPLRTGPMAKTLSEYPESTPEERLKKLAAAEEFLAKAAATEKFGRSWQNHALYGAVSLTSGLVTWLGFKRTLWDGVLNFALNTVVSEIQIFTQPTRSLKNYRSYCSQYTQPAIAHRPGPEFYVGACPGGISVRMVF